MNTDKETLVSLSVAAFPDFSPIFIRRRQF
jgi:hypothetical protein